MCIGDFLHICLVKVLDLLELEMQTAVSWNVRAGNWTLVLWKRNQCSSSLSSLSSSIPQFYKELYTPGTGDKGSPAPSWEETQRLPCRGRGRGHHRALEHRDRAQGRKQTQRPGTRTGCVSEAGPHWLGQWFALVLEARWVSLGSGQLRPPAAAASGLSTQPPGSAAFLAPTNVHTACLPEAAGYRQELESGQGLTPVETQMLHFCRTPWNMFSWH